MKITNATDYAIRAVLYIAQKKEKKYLMRSELSKECNIPDCFLGKILQALKKSEILTSCRGKFGGYTLAKNVEDITIYDIITAVEGNIYLNECLNNDETCSKAKECTIKIMLSEINKELISNLKNYNIKNLILNI
jgi:Rrf2 family protein